MPRNSPFLFTSRARFANCALRADLQARIANLTPAPAPPPVFPKKRPLSAIPEACILGLVISQMRAGRM